MSRAAKKLRRTDLPVSLKGATEFHGDGVASPQWVVQTAKAHPQFFGDLLNQTNARKWGGRRRIPGNIALAFFAYVASRSTEMHPWWEMSGEDLWRECGFARKPKFSLVYENFVRLESHLDAFNDAAARMIQHARKHSGGLVGRDIHVDGTEAETNARLVHDCQPGEPCTRASDENHPEHWQHSREQNRRRITADAHTDRARDERQKASEEAPPENDEDAVLIGDATELVWDDNRKVRRLKVGKTGCWYRLLDPDAGPRAYTKDGKAARFWLGYYNLKAIDHYTGAPVAVHVSDASVQEYHAYPELFHKLCDNVGEAPRAIVGDKGFSVSSVFELNTSHGVASVFPYRKGGQESYRTDKLEYDRDGIPRCKGCFGPTKFVRFAAANPKPRLWFRCQAPDTPECHKEQSIYCEHDWRYLLPLWRTTEAYAALRASHDKYERVHIHWRQRYKVAGDNFGNRPKRRGRACQQLRADAALCIEWLRILHREGWLGSARRNSELPVADSGITNGLTKRLARRLAEGLDAPYTRELLLKLGYRPPLDGTGPPGLAAPPGPEPPPGTAPAPA